MPKKDAALAIPDVHWSKDMTWSLLSEVEKDDNRLVLLGKRKKKENTSGDSKITVFQQIGAVVLPKSYKLNPTATGKAVKWKYDHLMRKYQQHGKHLRTTSEGIYGSDVEDNPSKNEFFDCYVPVGGPDSTTTIKMQSIWDEIVAKFPFFPVLHRILLSDVLVRAKQHIAKVPKKKSMDAINARADAEMRLKSRDLLL
ncbi:uncharacterized protein HD556DRAFT_1451113 [Suillus plorans]|uniref:Uncharacterized protein n=1 Tax=Suillus plorans TaxID=116603 RepID=A0A9P7DAG7_9AGAM|nr:uncharacterized protein HD556DRAFT_1451113 [Suillus plorans]KAG1785028.1 hypothetical protein HD556DRAFT_1451113 [Suillus plorans]